MNLQEKSDLVLTFAQVLQVNGQCTEDTVLATERLSNTLGLRAAIIPSWDGLQLEATEVTDRLASFVSASPTGVNMERVAFTMRAIDEIVAGRLVSSVALEKITAISHAAPVSTWLFTIAAAAGAAALSLLYGVQHLTSVLLVVESAAGGAILRRTLARYSTNPFLQPLCAALLAGIVGALAVRYQLSSALRLIAVCPCMHVFGCSRRPCLHINSPCSDHSSGFDPQFLHSRNQRCPLQPHSRRRSVRTADSPIRVSQHAYNGVLLVQSLLGLPRRCRRERSR